MSVFAFFFLFPPFSLSLSPSLSLSLSLFKGINREELLRLAGKRIMANNFDTSKLSKEGFFVSVDEKDRILPDGTVVASGLENRNLFHFSPLVRADFFVPCGGRPARYNTTPTKKKRRKRKKKENILGAASLGFGIGPASNRSLFIS